MPDKTAEIVVYCTNPQCHASGLAARELEREGYTRVRVLAEGKQGWLDAGLQLDRSEGEVPLMVNPE